MKFCTQCQQSWDSTFEFCPRDGTRLIDEPVTLDDPALLNRFEILAAVGHGPHGTVYQVRHRLHGATRALKVLLPPFAETPLKDEVVHRFRLAKTLTSRHSQRIYELEMTADNRLVVEGEWIEGTTLANCLGAQSLAPTDAVQIVGRLASALAEAHEKELLHLNLKAENIFLREDKAEQAVLTDFVIGEAGFSSNSYTPPEGHGSALSPASDVYMLAKLGLNLLKIPEEKHDRPQELATQLLSIVDSETTRLLVAGLDVDGGSRPGMKEIQKIGEATLSSPTEFARIAREIRMAGVGPPPELPGQLTQPSAASGKRSRSWKLLSWSGITVIACLLLYFSLWKSPGEPPAPLPEVPENTTLETLPQATFPIDFAHEVLDRPGEGDPSHHPHTLVTLNGYNLFVLRDDAGYGSTVERANDVVAKLSALLEEVKPSVAVRFSVAHLAGDYILIQEGGGGGTERILTISGGDAVGYNRRSQHQLTAETLALWYRERLQTFWDAFTQAREPHTDFQLPGIAVLARVVKQAQVTAAKESIPLLQALQEVLAGLSGEDIETLQESVFDAPKIPESLHEQLIHHETS